MESRLKVPLFSVAFAGIFITLINRLEKLKNFAIPQGKK